MANYLYGGARALVRLHERNMWEFWGVASLLARTPKTRTRVW